MTISIIDADLTRPEHANGVLAVLDEYSSLPIIAGKPLPEGIRRHLPRTLDDNPNAHVLAALDKDERVVGVAVCFLGFSTFAGKPLLNVHDLAVSESCRGQGVGGKLLDAAAEKARQLGCCRVTLEVVEENEGARRLYERKGFEVTQLFMKREL